MTMSTPTGEPRRPNVVTVGGKPGTKSGKASTKPSGTKPPTKGAGGKGGKPVITPVKVTEGRNWGPIALFTAVGLLAAGIIGWGAWAAFRPGGAGYSWDTRANMIPGITNYNKTLNLTRQHTWDPQKYDQSPPVGGNHNYWWQSCMGDIYDSPIPNEHAVHSLEHGAVWVTYQGNLPKADVDKLAAKVRGKEYTLMSPYEGLDHKVVLTAWGYQLKLDDVNDSRIDDFLAALRKNASQEPGAVCSGGNTATGTKPLTEAQAQAKGYGQ